MGEHSRIDSHKMMFHPGWVSRWKEAVNDWEKAKLVYPLYVEISPAGGCNHRCTFCALDFVGYKPTLLPKSNLNETLMDMATGGVRGIMYGGEGEPTLHPKLADIIKYTKSLGIDVALTTNGSCMNKRFLENSLGSITWIKASIDAGKKETYLEIHRPNNPHDWKRIFEYLEIAVALKRKYNYMCRIGAQLLLLPEAKAKDGRTIPGNIGEAVILAKLLKDIGVDYFVVKPYSHQPLSLTKSYRDIVNQEYLFLEKELRKISSKSFEIVFRTNAMDKYTKTRDYDLCLATPFAWAYIMADGSVYSCSVYLLDERFYLGNINEQSFKEIWEGANRKRQWEFMKQYNPVNCRSNCRMDEVNRYLWEIIHPPYNVNFI